MLKFIRKNKYIFIYLVIALIYSIIYVLIVDNENLLSMLFGVSLSYIAAFIFYLFQIYYPEKKKVDIINKIIKSRINKVLVKVDELYKEMFKLYIPGYSEETNVDSYMKNLLKFRMDDRTSLLNISRLDSLRFIKQNNYLTLKELTQDMILVLKDSIDFLYKTFPNYLSYELINVLEKINDSFFIKAMSFNVQSLVPFDFSNCKTNLFEEFWELYKELKKCYDRI